MRINKIRTLSYAILIVVTICIFLQIFGVPRNNSMNKATTSNFLYYQSSNQLAFAKHRINTTINGNNSGNYNYQNNQSLKIFIENPFFNAYKTVNMTTTRPVDKEISRKIYMYDQFCNPQDLVGRVNVTLNVTRLNFSYHDDVNSGGHWRPMTCVPRDKVAIIIPYRDRLMHLHILLFYLIPILKRQQIEFRIFVIQQAGRLTFNKGIVMNAGFNEAVRMTDFRCYIFHDVDLIPENDRNMYSCLKYPQHLSPAVDKFEYRLPYSGLVGGVFAIRREDFQTVNGYSNLYWGWGAEDDDMSIRLSAVGKKLARPTASIARYKMIKHRSRIPSPLKQRNHLLRTARTRFEKDGLSTVTYNVTFVHLEPFYTHIMVDIGHPPIIA